MSLDTRACIRSSRIMKLVAEVSSSTRSTFAPTSRASMMFAAWEVEPEAFWLVNLWVSVPLGRFEMNGDMSTPHTKRPSSALITTASRRVTTYSRPSPGMWLYTPWARAESRVDFPW